MKECDQRGSEDVKSGREGRGGKGNGGKGRGGEWRGEKRDEGGGLG